MRSVGGAAALLLTVLGAPSAQADPPAECGTIPEVVPDFSLLDANERSPTFGQTYQRDNLQGNVFILYFAHATCGVCQAHVLSLQALWDTHAASWPDVSLLIVNSASTEAVIAELIQDQVTLPILQDTLEAGMYTKYGASKWYTYLIDPSGYPKIIHYKLSLPSDLDRLAAEIEAIRAEGS